MAGVNKMAAGSPKRLTYTPILCFQSSEHLFRIVRERPPKRLFCLQEKTSGLEEV